MQILQGNPTDGAALLKRGKARLFLGELDGALQDLEASGASAEQSVAKVCPCYISSRKLATRGIMHLSEDKGSCSILHELGKEMATGGARVCATSVPLLAPCTHVLLPMQSHLCCF